MAHSLERRVEKLEAIAHAGNVVAVPIKESCETEDQALKRAGVSPKPNDLVVFVRQFGHLVHGQPQ